MSLRKAVLFGLSAVALAAVMPPKLRAGTKMAVLIAVNGQPYHAMKAVMRLDFLSNCSGESEDGKICYLNDDDELKENERAFKDLPGWQQGHVRAWFQFLANDSGKVDLAALGEETMGLSITGLSEVSRAQFIQVIGAGVRSIDHEPVGEAELKAVFSYLDKDDDGSITAAERVSTMKSACNKQAMSISKSGCGTYVKAFENGLSDITMDDWVNEWLNEGGSESVDGSLLKVKEE